MFEIKEYYSMTTVELISRFRKAVRDVTDGVAAASKESDGVAAKIDFLLAPMNLWAGILSGVLVRERAALRQELTGKRLFLQWMVDNHQEVQNEGDIDVVLARWQKWSGEATDNHGIM